MDQLWTPWRMQYIQEEKPPKEGCPFCNMLAQDKQNDKGNFILLRAKRTFGVLNLYPYNSGHLLLLPYNHIALLSELDEASQNELMRLTTYFTSILTEALSPQGFNIGLNLGMAAGAGIVDHLHIHIVPRWIGDTNFMPVTGQAKVIPELLDQTYQRLSKFIQSDPPHLDE